MGFTMKHFYLNGEGFILSIFGAAPSAILRQRMPDLALEMLPKLKEAG